MQVTNYDLAMDMDFQKLTFNARVRIKLSTEQNVVLNSVELNILSVVSDGKNLRFRQSEEDLIVETGSFTGLLEVNYTGSIPDSLAGIYRAPYDHTHIVTTHFEAAQARRMLPCVDRPDIKAEFKIAVKIDKDLSAISNMPVESVITDGEQKLVTFQNTPPMSTYLLYLGVGKFEERTEKFKRTDVVVATTPGKVKLGEFSQDEAKKAIEFFESYYAIPYRLPKIHLIAVPEFAMGAMENWGAITFRESALLIDANSSLRTRKHVAEIVDHELAHQWFGNLVTMKWWDDIWLNESFATFMSYKVVNSLHPGWKVWEDFMRNETTGAMARDCLKNTHPIQVPVKSPDEIEQIFDAISYGKGASILRMIEAYVGEDAFQNGIRQYLSNHAYSNATGDDLWNTLEATSSKKVQKIMSGWIRQPGYPVLTAEVKDGKLVLRQERFLISGASEKSVWPIPVTMEVNGHSRSILMDSREEAIETNGIKSLKINLDRTGFYLVHYLGSEDLLWNSELSAIDKWGIVSDAFAFLLSGKTAFADYTKLLERFTRGVEYLPAHEISEQLSFLYTIMPSKVSDLSKTFHRSQLEILREKTDENGLILRGAIASRLTLVDDSYARELANQFKDYEKVPPDMKQAVTFAYARSTGDFDSLLAAYRKSSSDEDKIRFLSAMTTFTNGSLVKRTLDFALGEEVKRQDVRIVLVAATEKPGAKDVTWKWLRDNIEKLRKLYENTGILSGTFLSIIPILGIGRVEETETFFTTHKIADAEVGITAGLEKLVAYDRLVRSIA
ncbi:MAG: M1 family metallopeptidase [Candidatus Bathyarchaeia archaeon]